MSTTITMPEARTAPPKEPGPQEAAVTAPPTGTAETTATGQAGTDVAPKQPKDKPRHRALMIPIAAVAVLSGLFAAVVGFALSYGALRDAAVRWGFDKGWQSYAFPLGIDGLIIALYTADLVLAWRHMSRPWVRVCAHALTAVTIALNMSAAAGGMPRSPGLWEAVQADPGRLLGHAMMPIAYVILTEVARWAIVRTARLEAGGLDDQALTLADWLLNTRVTWRIFQHAKTYPATYADAREFVRQLAIYRVWQKERARWTDGTPQDRASVLDRMPALLAPYGVSVDEARAIPARMLAQEQAQEEARRKAERQEREDRERQKHDDDQAERDRVRAKEQREKAERRERERQEAEDAHQARMDTLAKEADQARQEAELAKLKALADGEVRAAAHQAEATAATAGIEAQAALSTAERAATEAGRRAEAEHQAEESARTAALRRKAAEDTEAATRAKATAERLAAETARLERQKADDAREKAGALDQAAELKASAARRDQEAAQLRAEIARLERQAADDEDTARLQPRERAVRKVARMVLTAAGGSLALYEIERALNVKESTASDYLKEARALIAAGYTPTQTNGQDHAAV
ncbi:DUF2637 domain-containing protein [Streptomyces sp. ADI98-10]|uniref:DUF2637 domain-containing protein n=1 Tax=Streptomyces sp. ADI98-10 TaxID=1522763 RepID=UPI000F554C7E|nr:DUF2637 domain-containing protein [Streptomyces sp. ADI98-10]RPK77820.1 hypothetical protein EES46_34710 [Streptomyces sp. ADI98-10]